jgi:hypothetical protein
MATQLKLTKAEITSHAITLAKVLREIETAVESGELDDVATILERSAAELKWPMIDCEMLAE